MKKSLIFLSLFTALSTVSCGSNIDYSKIAIDYGHIYKNGVSSYEQIELYYGDLQSMMKARESFVLLLYHNDSCTCWSNLFFAAKIFMNKYNVTLFPFDTANFIGKDTSYGIYEGIGDELPGIVFIRRGQVIRQTIYGNVVGTSNEKIFREPAAFESYMLDNIYLPKMYYLEDKELLDAKIETNEEFSLYVARNGCDDCNTLNKTTLYDWTDANKEKAFNERLYIFDIEKYRGTSEYQNIKDYCELSVAGNATFGFDRGSDRGMIPTFQRWKNGHVIDMITVINDALKEDKVTQDSYFTEARIQASPMLRNTGDIYLFEGRTVDEADIGTYQYVDPDTGETVVIKYLTRDAKIRMHSPIVKLYLSTYVE